MFLTNIPVLETVYYIIEQIYVYKKIRHICRKLIFKWLPLKYATECKFTFGSNIYRQIDVCTVGRTLSVTFSDIYLIKTENEALTPVKPKFYQRYVDNRANRRKKNVEDILFKKLIKYDQNIKFTMEISLTKFLDTKLNCVNGIYKTTEHRKTTKLPIN